MNCVSCDIVYACTTFVFVVLHGLFLSSRVTGACPVTTDLIMRVNVRTAATANNSNKRMLDNKKMKNDKAGKSQQQSR